MNKLSDPWAPLATTPPGAIESVLSDMVERPVIPTPIANEIPDFQNT